MRWKPYDYYTASPYEFFAAVEGYAEHRASSAKMLRLASFRIHQSLVEKPLSLSEYWPIDDEKDQDEIIVDQDMIDQIKKIHNIK